ncbi:hypothetical protein T265_12387 [Opisthorchis viverrini]|uniref:Uncharacterized protein n=1 Tax=Opisthorchis viverrini TaxID=6198 RepID=A0A074YTD8_OPIVI|nr:hypothetical protein T265_12387 [Opisthorchis viverrini]KER18056.1 hypothetical protein T265_12387 [Opisthorchis viverrini]
MLTAYIHFGVQIYRNLLPCFATRFRILRRWCSLSIRLINLDPRLDMGEADAVSTHSRKGGEFLRLLRQVLSALLPDCVQLAAAKHSSTDYGSQDSTMSVFLGQSMFI